ncbi:MAG TPA: hypothetical protein ENF64_00835 [Hadesarchaea archaeon]|nr:hypothetical protein [Hadesarchaea archaeon]
MAGLISRKFVPQGQRGVSDVLTMAFMFLLVIFSGVLLHAYGLDAISSATDRQLQMKAEYFYKTLELAQVENYSLSYFEAVAENLIGVTKPVVPGDNIREGICNLLAYLHPDGYGVKVELNYENSFWVQMYLFDLPLELKQELQQEQISDRLRENFKQHGYEISEQAEIRSINTKEWDIIDGERTYVVKEHNKQLNVFFENYTSSLGWPDSTATQFTFSGKVTIIIAEASEEERVAQIDATLTLFRR